MNRYPNSAGFTLPELMISLVIGMTIMLAVSTLFATSQRAQTEIRKSSQQIESAFIANQMLAEQVRLAGFYGELDPIGLADPGAIPDICDIDASIKLHVQGLNNVANASKPSCIPENIVDNTDILVIRRVGTCIAGAANCADTLVNGNVYLQVSRCNQDESLGLPPFYFATRGGSPATPFDLHMNCPSTVPISSIGLAPLRQYRVQIYYVAANNQAGDGIPTLKRLDLMGGTPVSAGLASGIANFQVQYGIDATTSRDGNADSFVSVPASVAEWPRVVAIKVWLLGRNIEVSPGYNDSKTYVLGDENVAAPNDGYKRDVLTAEIRLTNPAGRRE